MTTKPIKISVSNQRGFIWDIQDVQALRVQHHICGILSGTLPQVGQQNVFLGLPLMLLPEEVVLLVKNNIAVLVDDQAAHRGATVDESKTYMDQRQSAILEQQTEHRRIEDEKKSRALALYGDKIAKKQRDKAQKKVADAAAAAAATAAAAGSAEVPRSSDQFEVFVPELVEEGHETTGPPPSQISTAPNKDGKGESSRPPISSIPYTIIIQPSSTDMPWYDPEMATVDSLDRAREIGLWHYPLDALQRARCNVFEDLWRKGHFMGGGLRFGGDFLVYPGDPLRYHSHFTLTVLASPATSIMPLDVVAYGRLATAVKKAHLLASWNDETHQAEYFSLEWAAFG